MKYVVCVPDGCADEPLAELGGRTPLEAARTPVLDALAARGEVGRAAVIPPGLPPGQRRREHEHPRLRPRRPPHRPGADRGRRARPAPRARPGRLPLQPRDRRPGRRRRDDGRLRRRPPVDRGRRRGHRARSTRSSAATASRSTPACSTATSWWRPADLADADCAPPHDLSDQRGGVADRARPPPRLRELMEASRAIVGRVGLAANQVWLWGQGAAAAAPVVPRGPRRRCRPGHRGRPRARPRRAHRHGRRRGRGRDRLVRHQLRGQAGRGAGRRWRAARTCS